MRGLGAVGDARRVLGVDPSVRRAGLVVLELRRGARPRGRLGRRHRWNRRIRRRRASAVAVPRAGREKKIAANGPKGLTAIAESDKILLWRGHNKRRRGRGQWRPILWNSHADTPSM